MDEPTLCEAIEIMLTCNEDLFVFLGMLWNAIDMGQVELAKKCMSGMIAALLNANESLMAYIRRED